MMKTNQLNINLQVKSVLLAFCLILFTGMAWAQPMNFFVSTNGNDSNSGLSSETPLATLDEGINRIAVLKKDGKLTGPVNIMISGGVYNLTTPVKITPENSGSPVAPVTIRPSGSEKVVFDGSSKITGWKKYRKNIWSAAIPEVKAGKWKFRQLFVNGEPRTPARFPNEGFYIVAGFPDGGEEVNYHIGGKRFEFRPGDLNPDWINPDDIRVIIYHFWTDTHMQIDSINTKTNIVTFKYPADKRFTDDFTSDGARYIVENVFEGLDKPGEWYLNSKTGVIYYIPLEGEDMTKAEIVAPVLPEFIRITGDEASLNYAENINFKDITFQYTNFMLPEGDAGDMQAAYSVPGAVTFNGARNISFDGCRFYHLGTYAFDIRKGSSELSFTHNIIEHISAGGFKINGGEEMNSPLERTRNITISDNEIGYFGEDFQSAVGILLMNAEGNYIGHNHIHHGWYTGISVGWQWGYGRSISRDNILEYNYIHDIGQGLLSDMGGIYTLGISPGTVLRNNLIHDVESNRYGGWGIYNDEGSTHILIENNIVYNTKYAAYDIHYAKEITVRNNIWAFGRLEELNRTRGENHNSVYFENNIVYWKTLNDPYSADWKDKTYTHYINPNRSEQQVMTSNFTADYNIYFNPLLPPDSITFNGNTWKQWNERGKDVHSLYTDPMFVDPEKYNFSLKPESPAFKMGFKQIDMSAVGVRKKAGK